MANAIEVEGLSKSYRLGVDPTGYDTLRDAIMRAFRRDDDGASELWALRDLSFSVEEGEAVGIIGDNGAGKTTLLKILSGITEPTHGEARTRGRVGPLLEVGTGMHPELTGRENIFLSAAVLGMRRAETRSRFAEIVEFSGLSRFLDTPLKRYSTGMRLRLAFAVAAYIEPPILAVDEVLAVGDRAFQEKCLGKISELSAHARTVLFVSHDLGAVTRLCSRAIWIDAGCVREDGPPLDVGAAYLDSASGRPLEASFPTSSPSPVSLRSASVRGADGSTLTSPRRDEPFRIELRFVVEERIPHLTLWLGLIDQTGVTVFLEAHSDSPHEGDPPGDVGEYEVSVLVPPLLAPGRYTVKWWIATDLELFVEREVLQLQIAPRADDPRELIERSRLVQAELSWRVHRRPSA